ncbi:MAG: ATP-binding cassette domain-containing protein [Pseudomonadota bacterium]
MTVAAHVARHLAHHRRQALRQRRATVDPDLARRCPGPFVALLGPSGCGKTTVLRLAAGLEQPSGGALALGAAPPALSDVVPEPTRMPWASVADNVALPLRIARLPAARIGARVTSALAAARLERFVASLPAELSGA